MPGNEEKSFTQKITKVTKTILSIETAYALEPLGLVAREYLRQVCKGDATATPVRHICMMAPANFGSPLATLGESIAGRVLKAFHSLLIEI